MLKNIGNNWVLTLVTAASAYLLMPFFVHALGEQGYGTWTLIGSITGYLSLLVLGVPMASVRYFAQHVAEGDQEKLNEAIGTCLGLYLLMGLSALCIGAVLFAFFDLIYALPASLRFEARLAFVLVVLQISAGFVGQVPFGIMAAHHDFVLRNVVLMGSLLLRLGLTFGLLALKATLIFMALIQMACLVFEFSVSYCLIRRRYPGIRMSLADFDRRTFRRIVSFSLYVLLLNAGARLAFETDSLVIGAFMDVGQIPFYTVANSFLVYLMEFVIGIAAVVMPTATKLKTQGRVSELKAIFLVWSKIALSVTMVAGLFLIVLGPRFIGWWIGSSFEGPAGEVLQILMVSSLVFLPVRGVAFPILMGLGKPGLPTVSFVAAGLLNLLLSLILVGPLGLNGVALGTAIPNVLFALVVLVLACRELEIPLLEYVRYVVPKVVLGAMPVLVLLLWFEHGLHVRSLPGLVTAGTVMLLVYGSSWVFFINRNDPYLNLSARLNELLKKLVGEGNKWFTSTGFLRSLLR